MDMETALAAMVSSKTRLTYNHIAAVVLSSVNKEQTQEKDHDMLLKKIADGVGVMGDNGPIIVGQDSYDRLLETTGVPATQNPSEAGLRLFNCPLIVRDVNSPKILDPAHFTQASDFKEPPDDGDQNLYISVEPMGEHEQ